MRSLDDGSGRSPRPVEPEPFEVPRSMVDGGDADPLERFLIERTGSSEAARTLCRRIREMELGPEVDFVRVAPRTDAAEPGPPGWAVYPGTAER